MQYMLYLQINLYIVHKLLILYSKHKLLILYSKHKKRRLYRLNHLPLFAHIPLIYQHFRLNISQGIEKQFRLHSFAQ